MDYSFDYGKSWSYGSDSETVEEIVEEYDGDGKLVRKTVTKTTRTKPRDFPTRPWEPPYKVTFKV